MKEIIVVIALSALVVGCSDAPGKVPNSGSADAGPNNANNSDSDAGNNANNANSSSGSAVCPGFTAPAGGDGECRSDADCANPSAYCAPAENTAGCGAGCPIFENCFTDTDCVDGEVCQVREVLESPCCPGETRQSECQPPCTETSCRPEETCAADGHCEPMSCEDGFACEGDDVCDPARATADQHGCAPPDCTVDDYTCPTDFVCDAADPSPTKCAPVHCDDGYACPENSRCDSAAAGHGCVGLSCSADTDCDCGACVMGSCAPHVWICTFPSA